MSSLQKRVPNFSAAESRLLTQLVRKYKQILSNKRTNAATNRQKEETWKRISEEFARVLPANRRDAKCLKAKYENVKKTLKRKCSVYRRGLYAPGGGPPVDSTLTPDEETILEVVEGLPSSNGCDEISPNEEQDGRCSPSVKLSKEYDFIPSASDLPEAIKHTINDKGDSFKDIFIELTPVCQSRLLLQDNMSAAFKSKKTLLKSDLPTSETLMNNSKIEESASSNNIKPRRKIQSFDCTMEEYGNLARIKMEHMQLKIKRINQKMNDEKLEHEQRMNYEKLLHEQRINNEKSLHELRISNEKLLHELRTSNEKMLHNIRLNIKEDVDR